MYALVCECEREVWWCCGTLHGKELPVDFEGDQRHRELPAAKPRRGGGASWHDGWWLGAVQGGGGDRKKSFRIPAASCTSANSTGSPVCVANTREQRVREAQDGVVPGGPRAHPFRISP